MGGAADARQLASTWKQQRDEVSHTQRKISKYAEELDVSEP